MHGRTSSSPAFVAPKGFPGSSRSVKLTQDGKRLCVEPLAMFTGFEGEAFSFLKDVVTAGATGGTGDVIAQLAEKNKFGAAEDESDEIKFFEEPEGNFELDVRRSLSYTSFAAAYTGAFQHFLFANLQDAIPDPIVRVAVNQGLIIPLCYYSLLVFLVPKLRAKTKQEEEDLRGSINLMKMIPRNWLFWVPLQFVQFNFIPIEFQVVYCSCLSLIWNIILSLLTAGGSKEERPLPETVMADISISIPDAKSPRPAGQLNAMQSASSANYDNKNISIRSNRSERWLRILNNDAPQDYPKPAEAQKETREEQEDNIFASAFRRER